MSAPEVDRPSLAVVECRANEHALDAFEAPSWCSWVRLRPQRAVAIAPRERAEDLLRVTRDLTRYPSSLIVDVSDGWSAVTLDPELGIAWGRLSLLPWAAEAPQAGLVAGLPAFVVPRPGGPWILVAAYHAHQLIYELERVADPSSRVTVAP